MSKCETVKMDRTEMVKLTQALTDSGKIIEAGWVGLKLACVPETASEVQITEMRKAFFAGAPTKGRSGAALGYRRTCD